MKRIFTTILLFSVLIFNAQTKLWSGGGDGSSWNDALNWNPAGVPCLTDNVLLDNSVVTTTYTVSLPGGNTDVSINSLTITPSGSNNITLQLPVTNTSPTAFIANGAGDAVVLNKGAVFINSSGASSGTPVSVTGTNFFRINNGGRYIHNTPRGHTTNLAARLSTVAGTEKGIFEFDVPAAGYTVSLSGRTYGTLILSSTASGGAVTYSGNGTNPVNINGNFKINTGVTFSIGMSGDFIVKGDYTQAISSTFNLQNSNLNNSVKLQGQVVVAGTITSTGTGLPVLDMNGTSNQNLSVTGSIVSNVGFRITNAGGVTLQTPLTLPYNLNLQNGKIKASVDNILTLIDNATVTGGSSASFIEGPMKKIGDDNFSFPVGKGSIYAPIGFTSTGMAATDAFQAEYFRLDPQVAYGTNYETPPINHISYVEYWKLEKTSGNTAIPANVTLTVTSTSFAKNINTLYVAKYNPSDVQWKNTGILSRSSGPASPPYITGSVTSMPVTQFGIFTLATTEPHEANPLPVNFIFF